MTRRVLVCGGRDYVNREEMTEVLSSVLRDDDLLVVHGAAPGADSLAGDIAGRVLGYRVEVYPADWHQHGKAAGPIRNQQMLDTGIDLVIAFGGGRGTADMIQRADKAGVSVIRYG